MPYPSNNIDDELGVARPNTALSVLVRGICRVTAQSGSTAELLPGMPVQPTTTGSGIVGQTGATGIGSIWATAAFVTLSATAQFTAAAPGARGGVARIVRCVVAGSTGQIDIQLMPQRPDVLL